MGPPPLRPVPADMTALTGHIPVPTSIITRISEASTSTRRLIPPELIGLMTVEVALHLRPVGLTRSAEHMKTSPPLHQLLPTPTHLGRWTLLLPLQSSVPSGVPDLFRSHRSQELAALILMTITGATMMMAMNPGGSMTTASPPEDSVYGSSLMILRTPGAATMIRETTMRETIQPGEIILVRE